MPCLAFETPVLILDTNDNPLHSDGRYEGLKELCNLIKEDDFMKNKNIYNFETPPCNSDEYKVIRKI